jgi:hypothetical protein
MYHTFMTEKSRWPFRALPQSRVLLTASAPDHSRLALTLLGACNRDT